jgi:hypothetical protein
MLATTADMVDVVVIGPTVTVTVVIIPIAVIALAFVLCCPLVLLLHQQVVFCCFASVAGLCPASLFWLIVVYAVHCCGGATDYNDAYHQSGAAEDNNAYHQSGAAEDNAGYLHGGEAKDDAAHCHGSAAKDNTTNCHGSTVDNITR